VIPFISNYANKNFLLTQLNIKRNFEDKAWITLKEFPRFLDIVLWSYSMQGLRKPFMVLVSRISSLVKKSGWTFTFKYLKEVLRIMVRLLAQNEVVKSSSIFVKTDKHGCPTIIPFEIRDEILLRDFAQGYKKLIVGALFTILSIHRVFPTKVIPSVDTIIEPFSALSKTLDRDLLVKSLKELGLYSSYTENKRCSLYWSEASGPNTVIAGWGCINDALALLHTPKQLYCVVKSLIFRLNLGLLLYFILVIIVFGPLYILLVSLRAIRPFENGRLSVVYDQAGKARVIAITSYWIQTCLKPLHLFLFKKLDKLKSVDGTFDQDRPFNDLLSRMKDSQKLYGFDLSAATDRLPIDLQSDILKLIGFNLPWKDLLDISWAPNFSCQYDKIKYSVGQPMGALSSWAMLAITHHVIVRCAAIRQGIKNFKDYCILGDDIVIANDIVATEYLNLMGILGLSVNRQKSVESFIFTEFAKKLKGYHSVDYSPLGPGLILQTLRSNSYCVRLPFELFLKGLVSLNSIGGHLLAAPKWFRRRTRVVLWATILGTYTSHFVSGAALDLTSVRMEPTPLETYMFNSYIDRFYVPILNELKREFVLSKKKLGVETKTFLTRVWVMNLTRSGYHSLPSFLNFLNLGFWLLIFKYIKDAISLIELHCKIYCFDYYSNDQRAKFAKLPDIIRALDFVSIASIDYGKKTLIKDMTKTMASLVKESNIPLPSIHQIYVNFNLSPAEKARKQFEQSMERSMRFIP
jgi:hypothetical protein